MSKKFDEFYTKESKADSASNFHSLREYVDTHDFHGVDDQLLRSIIHNTLFIGDRGVPRHNLLVEAYRGHLEVVKYFVEVVGITKKDLFEALVQGINGNHLSVVRYLGDRWGTFTRRFPEIEEALIEAASNGNIEMIEYLFDMGAVGDRYNQMLVAAASNGHLETLQYLFSIGNADTIFLSNNVLWAAMETNQLDVGNYLIDMLRDFMSIQQLLEMINRAMAYCASMGLMDFFQLLERNGGDVHYDDEIMLRQAVLNHRWDMAHYLLNQGARPHLVSRDERESAVSIARNELTNAQLEEDVGNMMDIVMFLRVAGRFP